MIDRAGLKGTRCGGAHVSEQHANFIVADRRATASDVLRLIDVVRDRVRTTFDTELELEIDVWRPTGEGTP
jgi:UDP-N-acetylmuramate dehydrogenase